MAGPTGPVPPALDHRKSWAQCPLTSDACFTIFCQLFQSRAEWLSSCRFAPHHSTTSSVHSVCGRPLLFLLSVPKACSIFGFIVIGHMQHMCPKHRLLLGRPHNKRDWLVDWLMARLEWGPTRTRTLVRCRFLCESPRNVDRPSQAVLTWVHRTCLWVVQVTSLLAWLQHFVVRTRIHTLRPRTPIYHTKPTHRKDKGETSSEVTLNCYVSISELKTHLYGAIYRERIIVPESYLYNILIFNFMFSISSSSLSRQFEVCHLHMK